MSKSIRKANAVKATAKGANLAQAFKLAYFLNPIGRGALSGYTLQAYTRAWMVNAGMHVGATMAKSTMQKVAGDTMVAYHRKIGNLETADNGELQLSAQGIEFFSDSNGGRRHDSQIINVLFDVVRTGTADGVIVKNPRGIEAL